MFLNAQILYRPHSRSTKAVFLLLVFGILICSLYFATPHLPSGITSWSNKAEGDHHEDLPKEEPEEQKYEPVADNFPLLTTSPEEVASLPPIPSFNAPPLTHVPENTPLFIGFTRNWPLLQQTVVSYITAGWPPSDIFVVDNTGTMNSNALGKLTLQNPFYLNHERLIKVFGVKVVTTPALLTFAQLQAFYMSYAQEHQWETYFWGHMDVAALAEEDFRDPVTGQYKSLYIRAVEEMRKTLAPGFGKWAGRYFAYDRLALVNLQAYIDIGGWDPLIGYYFTDCDFNERLYMEHYSNENAQAGRVFDVGTSVDDLSVFFRREAPEDALGRSDGRSQLNSTSYHELLATLTSMRDWKLAPKEGGRNIWQRRQQGGQGEPFYRDADGFQKGLEMIIENGRNVFREKWQHGGCDLRKAGKEVSKAWKYTKDH